jgi:hypothetical protein
LIEIRVLNISALENILGVADAELIANGRNISCNCTIAEGYYKTCSLPNLVGRLKVLLVAHGTLDETGIDVVRVFLDVHDRTEDEICFLREFEEGLVEIEK